MQRGEALKSIRCGVGSYEVRHTLDQINPVTMNMLEMSFGAQKQSGFMRYVTGM